MKLWPSRAFWRGFASAFNLAGDTRRHFDCGRSTFTVSRSPEEAARLDAEALASDWRTLQLDVIELVANQTAEDPCTTVSNQTP